MEQASAPQLDNKALIHASFERWKNGTGGPFELLVADVEFGGMGNETLKPGQLVVEFRSKGFIQRRGESAV